MSPFKTQSASVLELPRNTIYSSQTHVGEIEDHIGKHGASIHPRNGHQSGQSNGSFGTCRQDGVNESTEEMVHVALIG